MKNTKLLHRKRINAVLTSVYDFPLTILEAPMGYGKTTAIKEFIEEEKLRSFWFTFPDMKNSEEVFWSKFTEEVVKIDMQTGTALNSLGLPSDAPQMEKVVLKLADVPFGDKFVMVLDDFHLSHDMRLNKLILRLAQEELDQLHILLVTRDTSNIDFVELLSKGLCSIISSQHLKFNEQEIQAYCRTMLEGITDDDIKKIYDYTDGWISFIYIVLLGLENGIPIGMSTTIEEMIEKILFAAYNAHIQEFLLKLSVMEYFTVKQAGFVTENLNAEKILKKLSKENAFISYNEKSKTYKIHNILLDYLRLKQNFSKEEACELYCRLGEWYLNIQEFQTAYGYFYRAGQVERILAHLNNPKNLRNELISFDGSDDLFDNTPFEVLYKYPIAYLLYIFYSVIQGKKNIIMDWTQRLDELQQYYEAQTKLDKNYRNRVLGETLFVKKFTVFNHLSQITQSDKEIIRLLNGQNSYIANREYGFTFGSPQYLYIYFREAGTFKELSDMLSSYTEYTEFSDGCGLGGDSLSQAEYALETGDFDKVEQNCLFAIEKAETMSQTSVIICARFCLIRLRIVQGRPAEALALLDEMQREVEKENRSIYNTAVDLCKGFVYASICQPDRIPTWLQIGDMTAANMYYQGVAYNYLVYGKTVMATKKYAKLDALTRQFKKLFAIYSNQLGFIYNYIFEAVAKCNLYGVSTGAAILQAALNEAQADKLVMPFVESAPHIIDMMQVIVHNNPDNEYMKHILSLCHKYEHTIHGLSCHSIPISQREIDILLLAAEGLSRKDIAINLRISEETVKTHIKNIYQKLGAKSKVSAINLAQNRGYLKKAGGEIYRPTIS